jgi:membrane protease subunit HflK
VRRPDEVVMLVAEAAFREIVGKSSMDYVLYEGREQIAVQAQKLTQDILDRYKAGVAISRVQMQNAQPPEQVQAAFDDAVKARQDQDRQRNEGQAYFNDVVPKARGAAARLSEEASGYRQRVVATAEGDASRFRQILVEYSKSPAVTRERMYLETVQQIMSSTSKVMIDAKAGGNLLFLPLDKIIQMSASGAIDLGQAPKTPQPEAQATPAPSVRPRDGVLNRDREARP